jgi:hypothetical protein
MFHNRLDTNEGVSVKKFRGEIKKIFLTVKGRTSHPKMALM